MIFTRVIRLAIILSIFIVGCQVNPQKATPQVKDEVITVAAAADLQFAFTEIAHLYEENTGVKVTLVFGSTGQLVQQIENGAPFDLIAAANTSYIDRLNRSGLVIPESQALYARGRLVLAVNRESGVNATTLQDLLSPQIHHITIANPEHAPYGTAAMQALQTLGLWESLQPKLVYAENVRQALQYVQTGDAEVGIVSLSVANVPEITWTLIDDSLHTPLDQALAVLINCKNPQLANNFIAFINGVDGRPVMRKYGFLLPDEIQLVSGSQPTVEP
ncbi:molybdenum ABC transporter, periplasmic molybdate-binding protein [Anaerolinea thermolimosa]|uniref:molybdate ABC transporter substrate-binding protein n=1 Tax=Anaerolinea thermolimosa TaxID=229919 RepID=UPI000ABA6FFB|nr:molybdate ABC transporter substrate-binding protein [Anaerolinea thermolimosa]GAP06474.1 molybdenum ABC transporter, periplasmic molybdate-binding protein [Anaerolinea thermolimosa]